MVAKLDDVRKGQLITADAWNTIVERVNTLEAEKARRFDFLAPKKPKTNIDIRPARLASAWAQNAAGVWQATANFIVDDVVDTSSAVDVYAPIATSDPGGTVNTTRFYVLWRGRWELLPTGGGGDVPSLADLGLTTATITYVSSVTISNGELSFNRTTKTVIVPES